MILMQLAPAACSAAISFALLLGVVADIGVDREDQEALVPAALEHLSQGTCAGRGGQVELAPGVQDAQVGIGIEPGRELAALMPHVRLDRVVHAVPIDTGSGSHGAPRPLRERAE